MRRSLHIIVIYDFQVGPFNTSCLTLKPVLKHIFTKIVCCNKTLAMCKSLSETKFEPTKYKTIFSVLNHFSQEVFFHSETTCFNQDELLPTAHPIFTYALQTARDGSRSKTGTLKAKYFLLFVYLTAVQDTVKMYERSGHILSKYGTVVSCKITQAWMY